MKTKRIQKIISKSYFVFIFLFIIVLVGAVVFIRLLNTEAKYVFVKVKMGQGYWWVTGARPPIWVADAIKKGDISYGILGKPSAEVVGKNVYRYYGSDQYDVYMTIMLRVGFNEKNQQYTFDRSVLAIGAPVNILFPSGELTGTVTAISNKPFNKELVEKTITLVKKYAYPFEYDSIKIGDSYNDGERSVFEVINKSTQQAGQLLGLTSTYSNNGSSVVEPANYVTVKAKIKLKKIAGQWVFGEEQIVTPGRSLSVSTPSFVFDNYLVSSIE